MDFLWSCILFCHSLNSKNFTLLPGLQTRDKLKPANMRKTFTLVTGFVLMVLFSSAQNNTTASQQLKLFIDCKAWNCPFDYIRSEINFVNYVNDRYDANVYILVTTSGTGGGGREYKLYFEGLQNFKLLNDTLSYIRNAVETDDEDRKKMVQVLKLGLTRFIARTTLGSTLRILAPEKNSKEDNQQAKKDKWNSWIFNTGVSGNFSGDDNYNSSSLRASVSAGRVTEKLKLNFSAQYNKDNNKYIYNDYDTITGDLISSSTTRSAITRSNFNSTVAVSINKHWSYGLFSNFYTSSFSNIKQSFSVKPALEYSVFPYKTFTTKYIGILYRVGTLYNKYVDTTWRNKSKEWLAQQNISFDLNFNQKWGTFSASLYWANYFFNWNWHNYGVFANGEFRIIKGLNLNFFAGASIIHDQVELQKDNATQTQVLIRQRLLRNTFNYFTGFGLSYRFGSIYNNVVNPRLGDAGGGGFFFSN
jgi:hypothetical protein